MYKSVEALDRVSKTIDRYFLFAPIVGAMFLGVSIYFKVTNWEDIIDTVNLILNIASLVIMTGAYALLILSIVPSRVLPGAVQNVLTNYFAGEAEKNKQLAHTLFAVVYFFYGIMVMVLTTYYNVMIITVVCSSLLMLLLIPCINHTIFVKLFLIIYGIIAFCQEFGIIPTHIDQISRENKDILLIAVFCIKIVILIVLAITKYIHQQMVKLEAEFAASREKKKKKDEVQNTPLIQKETLSKVFRILTGREFDVARLLAEGLTYREIAESLGISENTVRSHIKKIYSKYKINNRVELYHLLKQ